eukprot:scaffold6052_cov118-Cylindrotheca_fusiformis.AAC.11
MAGKTVAIPASEMKKASLFTRNSWKSLLHAAKERDSEFAPNRQQRCRLGTLSTSRGSSRNTFQKQRPYRNHAIDPPVMFLHQGRSVSLERLNSLITECHTSNSTLYLSMKVPVLGGIDRQNRVGSKFGGGGVSSAQQSERERKERLKQLALESIDLAKDPYLMRNHLGSYECKLCLTLHTNEANYLAHTQGKKHQQGLAKRAHMEKLRAEREGQTNLPVTPAAEADKQVAKKPRIGRPAYQVFKSRDADTNQRCLSFELSYPDIEEDLQPRHRFMSAFEQRVESPPDRRYQYLLFAADPYETVAFKIPNEPIDKEPGRFVTHWDKDDKKITLTMYFLEPGQQEEKQAN